MTVDAPVRNTVPLTEDELFKALGRFLASKLRRYFPEQVLGAYTWTDQKEGVPFTGFALLVTPKTLELLKLQTSSNEWGAEPQIVESDIVRVTDIEQLGVTWKTREGISPESEFLNDILQECRCHVVLSKPLGELGREFSLPVAEEIASDASSEKINGRVYALTQALRAAITAC